MLVVDSRHKVSVLESLWKIFLRIEDLPDLLLPRTTIFIFMRVFRRVGSYEMVRTVLYELLQKHEKVNYRFLTQASSFKEVGMDSLDVVELLADMEERLKVDLLDDEVVNTNTVEEALKVFTMRVDGCNQGGLIGISKKA